MIRDLDVEKEKESDFEDSPEEMELEELFGESVIC